MKYRFLMVLCLLFRCSPCLCAEERPFLNLTNSFEGRIYSWELRNKDLLRSPKWDTNQDEPPLAPRMAMRRAEAYVRDEIMTGFPQMARSRAVGVAIHPTGVADVWFYTVEVTPIRPGSNFHERLNIVVFMDGTIPEPFAIGRRK